MEFQFLADYEETIPSITEWHVNQWGYIA